jgi:hypothetical protein
MPIAPLLFSLISSASTLTQRWRRGWPVWQSSIYSIYCTAHVQDNGQEEAPLHEQHPHTEVEKGLARVGQSSTCIYHVYCTAHVQGNGQEEAPRSAPPYKGGEGAGPCGAELYIPHILYCACAGKWPGKGSTISTLTQRWRWGWPVWGRALYTAYTVLRMCREMARKRLHDQHPHTEMEKGRPV